MTDSITKISAVVLLALGLAACGSDDDNHASSSSSSVASSSSSADNVMEVGVEYPFNDTTVITNTGTTDLVVTRRFMKDSGETFVVLQEGEATID